MPFLRQTSRRGTAAVDVARRRAFDDAVVVERARVGDVVDASGGEKFYRIVHARVNARADVARMSSPLDIEMRGHTGALAYDFGTDYTRVFGQAPSASAQECNGPRSFDSASSSPSSMRVQKGTSWSSGGDASWRPHANLYVKNISERIDEMTLRTMFEACGEVVSCCVIRDVATNRSRGFGFVKFASTSRAEDAIERFNGRECAGKILEVKFANTDGESDKGDSHGTAPPSDNVYVKGLPPTWTQDNLKKYFSKFGHIVECRLLHANKSTSSGALIRFLRESEATAAVKATNGNVIAPGGPPLVVRYADAQGKNTKRGGQAHRTGGSMTPRTTAPLCPLCSLRASNGSRRTMD